MNNTNIENYTKIIRKYWANIVKDITDNAKDIPIIEDLHDIYLLINKGSSYNGSANIHKFYGILAKELICIMCEKNTKTYDQIYLFKDFIKQIFNGYIHRIYTGDEIINIFFEIELAIFDTCLDKYFEKILTTKIQDFEVKYGLMVLRETRDNTDFSTNSDILYYGLDAIINYIFNDIFKKLYFGESNIRGILDRYNCEISPDTKF